MEHYFGFNYRALQWLSSCLSNRLFSVKIGGSSLHAHTINFSVPQGRILGPVLLRCYVRTLPQVLKQTSNTIILDYADDHALTQAFTQKDTLVKQIREEQVDRIQNWISMNHLQVNDTRTEFITFGTPHLLSKKNLDSIAVGGTTVNCSKTRKFLCALVDVTLSFKATCGCTCLIDTLQNSPYEKCKEISYNVHHKNADVYSSTIPFGLYHLSVPANLMKKSRTKLHESSTKRPKGPVQHPP